MTCPAVWAFLHESIKTLKKQQWPDLSPNLTKKQTEVLNKLQKHMAVIVKPSDKGEYIVLMTHPQYQTMCLNVLQNPTWYRPIDYTLTQRFITEFRSLCIEAFWKGLVDRDTLNFINTKTPRMPTFYTLPKTHKNIQSQPGETDSFGHQLPDGKCQ